MNRTEWRQLSLERLADAQTLLSAKRWSAAYYLAGYAVECGLKACVLARVENTGVIFDDPKFVEQVRIHNLEKLVVAADLVPKFGAARQANSALNGFWGVVSGWSEKSRYENRLQADAEQLYEAITENPNGVLEWLQKHW